MRTIKQEIDMSKGILGHDPYDKQETLEEASINNYKELYEGEPLTQDVPIDAFKQGAKWQQQNSYGEEEVIAFGEFIFKHSLLTHAKGVKSLFEQFKKK